MTVLIWGLSLFIAAFFLHIAVWRITRPANTVKVLIALFSMTLLAGIVVLVFFARAYPDAPMLDLSFVKFIYISFLFFSLFMAYLLSYPAIEADSPSLTIIMNIARAGADGLPCEKITELLKDDLLIDPRIQDLVDAKLVDLADATYRINQKGSLFILPFVLYRNLLGLGKGG